MADRRKRAKSLHGNVRERSRTVLVLVDVINTFEFPGAEQFLKAAFGAAREIDALKRLAIRKKIPVIYANDNFGRWRSNIGALVRYCSKTRGGNIARKLAPGKNDYFVLKPKNSAFYATTLDLLLRHIGARTLILAGFAGNNCILFTANDAYLRDYRLKVPSDCVASLAAEENFHALRQMKQVLKADIRPWKQQKIGS